MRIKFCGAAREVTGSCHLVELNNGFKFLLDCGLYQGYDDELEETNWDWAFDPTEIDCVVLSHAHIDHSGKLPKLFKDGFRGCVRSTHATRSLCAIMLLDSAYIHERDAAYRNRKLRKKGEPLVEPLYEQEDVDYVMANFVTYGYNRWFKIHDDVEVYFSDAGHILGSAAVSLRIQEDGKEILLGFSGDIGRPDRPILRNPQPMPQVDYLICESTYGDRDHEAKPEEKDRFLKIIQHTCIDKRGKLIIPAFSVGRTQEIVYMLDQLETAGELPHIPVYVDSPLAVNATQVFGSHPECYDNRLHAYLLEDDNPFGFNGLHYIRNAELSKQLNFSEEPCIIISASGMMNAGRIRHHTYHNISQSKNTLLIVGYCAPQTPCGIIRQGAEYIKIFGDMLPVRAEIEIMDSFSAHGDRYEMLDFLKNQLPSLKEMYLVHGEYESQLKFEKFLNEKGFKNIQIPYRNQEFII
jgi:metallo-beta-lactamase family protein